MYLKLISWTIYEFYKTQTNMRKTIVRPKLGIKN